MNIRRLAVLSLIVVPVALQGCKSPDAESAITRADDFLRYDQFDRAAQAVEPVVRDQPGNWKAQYALGRALMGQGDLEGARRALDQAHVLRPTDADVTFALATCMARQNDTSGAYTLLRGYGREFRSWRAYLTLSNIAEQAGDADTAMQAAEDAIKVNEPVPGGRLSTEPYMRAAEVCFKYGRKEMGVRRLRQAYGVNPDDPRVVEALRAQGITPGKAIVLPPGV